MKSSKSLRRACKAVPLLFLLLASCSQKKESGSTSRKESLSKKEDISLRLLLNNTVLPVKWEMNSTVLELQESFSGSVELESHLYGGFERVCALPKKIRSMDERQMAVCGDIMLYQGNSMVLFYGTNTWEYTKLGYVDMEESKWKRLLTEDMVKIELGYN